MPDSLERHTNIVKQDWMQGNTIWCSADAYEACKEAMTRLADALEKEPVAFPVPAVGNFNEREKIPVAALSNVNMPTPEVTEVDKLIANNLVGTWQLATLSGKQLDDFAAQFGWPVRFTWPNIGSPVIESDNDYRMRLLEYTAPNALNHIQSFGRGKREVVVNDVSLEVHNGD